MKRSIEATKRQWEVMRFIKAFIGSHDYSPSIREIALNFGVTLKAAVDFVAALEKKGYIRTTKTVHRSIKIIRTTKTVHRSIKIIDQD
jgi:repressor LexA